MIWKQKPPRCICGRCSDPVLDAGEQLHCVPGPCSAVWSHCFTLGPTCSVRVLRGCTVSHGAYTGPGKDWGPFSNFYYVGLGLGKLEKRVGITRTPSLPCLSLGSNVPSLARLSLAALLLLGILYSHLHFILLSSTYHHPISNLLC